MPTSTNGEAEAGSVPTGGPALFMPTQGPGEGVPLVRLKSRLGADPALSRGQCAFCSANPDEAQWGGGHLPDQMLP